MTWNRKDILDIKSLTVDEIKSVLDTADGLKGRFLNGQLKSPDPQGKTVILFSMSRVHGRAYPLISQLKRLSADSISISASTSSLVKGETLIDTARNLESMNPDVVVMRHSSAGTPFLLSKKISTPIINAGDGMHAHPTQALLEYDDGQEVKKDLNGLRIAIVGDISHSRVARSNIVGFRKMGAKVRLAGPPTMIPTGIEALGADVTYDFEEAIDGVDVIMMLRIQKERQRNFLFPSEREYAKRYGLNMSRLEKAKSDILIMHPGPLNRGVEITPEVADHINSVILNQVTNGVALRMALLYLLAGGCAMRLIIKGGHVVDPGNIDAVTNIIIDDGIITGLGTPVDVFDEKESTDIKVIDAAGCFVVPGLIDMHVHLRDPGHEYKESIETGILAAAAGGFTAVCCMPNTSPVNDNRQVTEYIIKTAGQFQSVAVLPVASISHGLKGRELSEYGELKEAGAVAVSDDGLPVSDSQLMRRALEYAKGVGLRVISHCEESSLSEGDMNEGLMATRMGLAGIPNASESIMVMRDIALCELTGSPVHIAHVSTKESVHAIRDAKLRGVPVTAETAPHYFTLTDEAVGKYDTNAKMNPPLRSKEDRDAIRKGLADGTIDVIVTDHAPHSVLEKEVEFDKAANGIIGLETSLPLGLKLVEDGDIPFEMLIYKMSKNPSEIIGLTRDIAVNEPANLTIINLDRSFTYDVEKGLSKSKNSPFNGWAFKGMAVYTIVNGRVVFESK